MIVKQKHGKNEIEITGTQEQIFAALDRWKAEIKEQEPFVELCAHIRQIASERKLVGAMDLPIKQVAMALLRLDPQESA